MHTFLEIVGGIVVGGFCIFMLIWVIWHRMFGDMHFDKPNYKDYVPKSRYRLTRKQRKITKTQEKMLQEAKPKQDLRMDRINEYAKWTSTADAELTRLYTEKKYPIKKLSLHFGRSLGAIESRLKKLGLKE